MSSPTFKDHFSSGSGAYAAYRPTYPAALVDFLASISPGRARAWDCGCGTGQLSVLLADRFRQVVATDASASQIDTAQPHPGVTYRTALAQDSGLPDACVDLVTVAQAAHWFDLAPFYEEVKRVSQPGAAVALISYGVLHVEGDAVDAIVQHFYHHVVGPYWPPERRHVEEGYRGLPFPFREIQSPALAIEVNWQLSDLLGYVDTWSAVKAAEKALGTEVLDEFRASLGDVWGDSELGRKVTWPLSLRVGNV
jgi:SAM-dependent methyltransferase